MSKEMMPSWEEWNNLTPEQRDYSLFKTLGSIDRKLMENKDATETRVVDCEKRFKKIESQKFFNRAASFLGGIVGGVIAIVGKFLFE